jgi:hypothetical protein
MTRCLWRSVFLAVFVSACVSTQIATAEDSIAIVSRDDAARARVNGGVVRVLFRADDSVYSRDEDREVRRLSRVGGNFGELPLHEATCAIERSALCQPEPALDCTFPSVANVRPGTRMRYSATAHCDCSPSTLRHSFSPEGYFVDVNDRANTDVGAENYEWYEYLTSCRLTYVTLYEVTDDKSDQQQQRLTKLALVMTAMIGILSTFFCCCTHILR